MIGSGCLQRIGAKSKEGCLGASCGDQPLVQHQEGEWCGVTGGHSANNTARRLANESVPGRRVARCRRRVHDWQHRCSTRPTEGGGEGGRCLANGDPGRQAVLGQQGGRKAGGARPTKDREGGRRGAVGRRVADRAGAALIQRWRRGRETGRQGQRGWHGEPNGRWCSELEGWWCRDGTVDGVASQRVDGAGTAMRVDGARTAAQPVVVWIFLFEPSYGLCEPWSG
jgi:hypothetical protein